ncbi:MAG: carboxypeptidase regulatory-like domain-containing protein [Nitrospinae bacterium]|nr:carboxypeptidase regulatory-like domain-containing protein [Nitrospinota bacterium]MZH05322.1 carboxypeptidase regulatory-like domain-containing protein [Nitrospinota bacterium]MZH13413.1 carboxypeptidase regulatory-like domain-containing protein [Nitrospinota bacterium]
MKNLKWALLTGVLTLALTTHAFAKQAKYEEMEVKNGGSISGSVLFKGEVPPPIMEDLSKGKNAEFCATHPDTKEGGIRPRQKVQVKDGKLQNAVILIENINKGKAWANETINFDFNQCDIFPKVTVVRKAPKGVKKDLVTVTNQDDNILHNPHGYSVKGANRKTLFNKPLPSKGSVADVTKSLKRFKPKKDSHFFLQCDQHNFMEADARIVWNPYYSVSNDKGTFTIQDIPAGKYKVTAWHPYVGQVTQEVTVADGGKADTNFELAMK